MTHEDRDLVVSELRASRRLLHEAIAGLDPDQWSFKPSPEVWSIGETAEHIATVEAAIQSRLLHMTAHEPDMKKFLDLREKDALLRQAILNRTVKLPAPAAVHPAGRFDSPDSFWSFFDEVDARTLDFAQTTPADLRQYVAPHPIFAEVDGVQWLLAIALHTQRHVHQIEESKALLPTAAR